MSSYLTSSRPKKCQACLRNLFQPLLEESALDSSFILVTDSTDAFSESPQRFFTSAALSDSPLEAHLNHSFEKKVHTTIRQEEETKKQRRIHLLVHDYLNSLNSPTSTSFFSSSSPMFSSQGAGSIKTEDPNIVEWLIQTVCERCKNEVLKVLDELLSEREHDLELELSGYLSCTERKSLVSLSPSSSPSSSSPFSVDSELCTEQEVEALEHELLELNQKLLSFERPFDLRVLEEWSEKEYEEKRVQEEETGREGKIELKRRETEMVGRYSIKSFMFQFELDDTLLVSAINGCRFGSSPTLKVPWDEINSAWGHISTLFNCLTFKLNYHNPRFQVIPGGLRSSIRDSGVEYPLWGVDEFQYSLSRLLWLQQKSEFDRGVSSFLLYLKMFVDHNQLSLPYPVEGEKVGENQLTTTGNTEDKWSIACKGLLFNLRSLYSSLLK